MTSMTWTRSTMRRNNIEENRRSIKTYTKYMPVDEGHDGRSKEKLLSRPE